MQSLTGFGGPAYRGVTSTLVGMMRQEGILRPCRGMSALIVGAGPAHALYFSCYEYSKDKITRLVPSLTHVAPGEINPLTIPKLSYLNCSNRCGRCSGCSSARRSYESSRRWVIFTHIIIICSGISVSSQCIYVLLHRFPVVKTNVNGSRHIYGSKVIQSHELVWSDLFNSDFKVMEDIGCF